MPLWTLVPTLSVSKELVIEDALPASEDEWGERSVDELEQPKRYLRFTTEGLTTSEVLAIDTVVMTRGATYAATDMEGTTWTGRPASLEATQIEGTDRWNASVSLFIEELS
jgi:hypothetical protein